MKNQTILVVLAQYNVPHLTYCVDDLEYINIGDIVEVSFRSKTSLAVVIEKNIEIDFCDSKLKKIIRKLPIEGLSYNQLLFVKKACDYYMGNHSNFIKMVIPVKNLPKEIKTLPMEYKFSLPRLNFEQEKAYNYIKDFLFLNKHNTILIDGVTGSGKTEIYFAIIADILKESDKQVLVILPEIILSDQLIEKFVSRFNFLPITWHSNISTSKKLQYWYEIISGNARVIIGARSALFLPFKNLGLIIIEEEHDASYKQEEIPIYNARDMAILKASIEKIPVVLVSATPSIETYCNVKMGKYLSVEIKNRYNESEIPQINIIDLKKENLTFNKYISDSLMKHIKQTILKKEQSLLFINRKGYAPITLCYKCGYKVECKNCSTYLVMHKEKKRLQCHYCNFVMSIPKDCSECGSENSISFFGPGVEKIHEEILLEIPNAKIAIITKDTMKSVTEINKILQSIKNHEVDIIIGTQLVAKGHHFPKLSLVGIIDADIGLQNGDLRSIERTYQLLEQVSGRAGREATDGISFLQTYNADSQVIKFLCSSNRDGLYEVEVENREILLMPPFARCAIIMLSGKNEEKVKNLTKQIIIYLSGNDNFLILGPAESYPYKLRGKYRLKILLKCKKSINLQKYIKDCLSKIKIPTSILIKIDIDPYSFM